MYLSCVNIFVHLFAIKVKVSVYSGGKEKANITFEAFGSNNLTWFSPPRILSATYSDIHAATASVFSVEG